MEIPKKQKAQVISEFGLNLSLQEIDVPQPKCDEVLVNILYTGVCHTDICFMENSLSTKKMSLPMVAGHEGAGKVVGIGKDVKSFKIGDKVGVKIINRICGYCENCHTSGRDNNCENQEECIVTKFGTFQQYITVAEGEAVKLPENVDLKKAAPLMCAGITVYKGLKETNCQAGEIVAISGASGGLGSFAIQFAKNAGFEVIAIDLGDEKAEHCKSLGADHYLDASKPDLIKRVQQISNGRGPHGVLVVANAVKAFEDALIYVRNYGVVVAIGVPNQNEFKSDLMNIIGRHLTIKGTTLGNRQDFKEGVQLLAKGKIDIPVEVRGLSELPEILDKINKGQIKGRVVLDTSK
uniref:Enoyl reductase (ER) domain-containing protein n=1 Tax=Panagrolaimus sp. ES5 TaxID=591445 RepID=A0AC34FUR9_9BILA